MDVGQSGNVATLQSAEKYQGHSGQSFESFLLDSVFSENTINSIERKGKILKRKYDSLPEESEGTSTLKNIVIIVGSVLAMAFAKLMSDDKKW